MGGKRRKFRDVLVQSLKAMWITMGGKQQLIEAKIYPIQLEKELMRLEARREELFICYRDKCDQIIQYITDRFKELIDKNKYLERLLHDRDIRSILPKRLVEIAHDGVLKILALSDYRVHDIDTLVNFVSNLEEKPHIIIYAGDDIRRFSPIPLELITIHPPTDEFPQEIEPVSISSPDDYREHSSTEYGLLVCLPRDKYTERQIRERLLTMLKVTDHIHEILENSGAQSEKSEMNAIKELIAHRYPFLIIQEDEKEIKIIDKRTNTLIFSLMKSRASGRLFPLKGYCSTLIRAQLNKNTNFSIQKIGESEKFVYFYIDTGQPKGNIFEKLASHARYGLAAIIGNDDPSVARAWIRGNGVYELHNTWLKIGPFLIVGLEGSTCGRGPSGEYLESDVKLRLELASEMLKPDDKLIIVSHAPPRGLLDRAMRFGEKAIGSIALRDFIEECDKSALVICGHVHRCGGNSEKLDKVTVVNVSSHDSPFDRANVAWIVIDGEGNTNVNFIKLPSLVEHILKNESEDRLLEALMERAFLTESEAWLFIEMFEKLGEKFLSDLPELANFKFRYGFTWNNVFHLYIHGVKSPEQLTDDIYKEVLDSAKGLHRIHLMRGYVKVKREMEKGRIYLMHPIPLPPDNKIIVYDTEYSGRVGVLYGFLDLTTGELKQFWFDEKEKACEYLAEKEDYLFVYWGGSDEKILREELYCDAPALNLLYHVQISLVAPIPSATLRDVHDVLCGHEESDWWKKSFYEIDGFDKFILCNRILANPDDNNARKQLKDANSADILALSKIVTKLRELNFHCACIT